jgi:hypothetical protein
LQGPYVDRDGMAMLEGGGTLVLQGDERYRGDSEGWPVSAGP